MRKENNIRSADSTLQLVRAARGLCAAVERFEFGPPVTYVYNPLRYAHAPFEIYLRRYGAPPKRVVFLGMNPGPFGMAQTGIPFGEVRIVRDWLRIEAAVGKPPLEHPRRPVNGFQCPRSEVSGRRLWGLFIDRFGSPERLFAEHLVINYCPLTFMDSRGRNLTPAQLPAKQMAPLFRVCDHYLRRVLEVLQPEWAVGVGHFASERIRLAAHDLPIHVGQILHPSPSSPAANRDWAIKVSAQLIELGIWPRLERS